MTQYQLSFTDLAEFADWLDTPKDLSTDDTVSEDEASVNVGMSPLETLLTNRINEHIESNTFPTLSEAKTYAILDQINRQYNS